ncbi:MAG: hypothetical protein RLZZ241_2552 [Bacteroidota bacterium]|jgi:hypothetical protein
MKRFILSIAVASMTLGAFAQKGPGFGIKGGLNFNSNGDYTFDSAPTLNSDTQMGYNIGLFGQIGKDFFLRPELIYTQTKSAYGESDLTVSKLDAPVLVGTHLLNVLRIFAGPDFQYILNTDLDAITLDTLESDFTIGLQIGAGVDLGNLGVDLRYERGLTANEASFAGVTDRLDTRAAQFILGLSLKL